MIGKTISHYRILEKLGEGGMGVVYKAQDTKLDRIVALKFLSKSLLGDEESKTRFAHEAKAASALNHTNITTIHEIDEVEGECFICMEYVEGKSVKELIKEKTLSIEEVLKIAIQIAEGLNVAHKKGIVHRDIKSDNIMLTDEGLVKIMDFGLAKLKGVSKLTKTGTTLGTLQYMSPEQAQGIEVNQRSDIFSFGVVLYEMITGQLPFKGEHEAAIIYSIISETPEPLARYKANVPGELQRVVDKALAKNRDERYQHVDEMIADLKTIRRKLETTSTIREPSKPKRLKKRLLYFSASLAAILIIILVLSKIFFFTPSVGAIDSIAVLPLQNLSGDPNQEYFADGMTDALTNALCKIGTLRVISHTSVMQYKGARKPLSEIARELQVAVVVEGSVLRSGQRVRINARLIHAGKERQMWAESYERDLSDVLSLQSEMARTIAREVQAKLTPEDQSRLASAGSVIPEAYEAYLLGCHYATEYYGELDFRKALEHFHRAIQIDPKFALGYAGLAGCYTDMALYIELSPDEAAPNALDAAAKAVQLDDKLAEAHAALSYAKLLFAWDLSGAERELLRALELNPNSPDVIDQHRFFLVLTGRAGEAVPVAIRFDQVQPGGGGLGWTYFYARRYDDAIAQLKKELEVHPNSADSRIWLATAYAFKGMHEEALAECDHLQGMHGAFDMNLGYIYAVAGRRDKSLLILDRLRELGTREYVDPYSFACIYAGLGDKDQAIAWLRKGLEVRSVNMGFLKAELFFDSLRSDPRFRELLKKIGLEK